MATLKALVSKVETRMSEANYQPTIAEYVKLLQVEHEMEEEEITEVKAGWVDRPSQCDSER